MSYFTHKDLPVGIPKFLEKYLPQTQHNHDKLPFITLTYAQSLDSRISKKRGLRTVISHIETKVVTHYIRSLHDALLIGINTVLADDPGLNCRFESKPQRIITPVIIDPNFRLQYVYAHSKLEKNVSSGSINQPIVVVSSKVLEMMGESIKKLAGAHQLRILAIEPHTAGTGVTIDEIKEPVLSWCQIFKALKQDFHIQSVMVEGGAGVINSLLVSEYNHKSIVDSLIITIGPVFLGKDGVEVSPADEVDLENVSWWTGIRDSIMCSDVKKKQI